MALSTLSRSPRPQHAVGERRCIYSAPYPATAKWESPSSLPAYPRLSMNDLPGYPKASSPGREQPHPTIRYGAAESICLSGRVSRTNAGVFLNGFRWCVLFRGARREYPCWGSMGIGRQSAFGGASLAAISPGPESRVEGVLNAESFSVTNTSNF